MRLDGALYSDHYYSRKTITFISSLVLHCCLFYGFLAIWLIFSFLDPYFATKEHLDMLSGIYLSMLYLQLGCMPIKKFRTERNLIIRYLRHLCFSSITLSPRYVISSSSTFIIGLILLVFTVLTSRISWAERSVMMLVTGSPILLLELVTYPRVAHDNFFRMVSLNILLIL